MSGLLIRAEVEQDADAVVSVLEAVGAEGRWIGTEVPFGTRLVEHGVAWARQVGAHKITLETWPHDERATGLYRKMGFVEEGRLQNYRRRNGESDDVCRCRLDLS